MANEEPSYTPTQLAEMYYQFIRDKQTKHRMEKDNLPYWEQTELVIRFLGYMRNYEKNKRKGETEKETMKKTERRESRLFGEPTRGDLFGP